MAILPSRPPIAFPAGLTNQGSYATSGTDLGGTSRHQRWAMQTITGPQVVYANFYPNGTDNNVPTNAGNITIQAVLEYPVDTFYPLTFNGNTSATISLTGTIVSDPLGIEIIAGQPFWVRTYVQTANPGAFPIGVFSGILDGVVLTGANGLPYVSGVTQCGDNYHQHNTGAGTNALTTAGQSWISLAGQYSYGPMQVLGKPSSSSQISPVVALLGDSILDGSIDLGHDFGAVMRYLPSIGVGYYRLCKGGENGVLPSNGSWQSPSGHVVRATFLEVCTSAIWQYGTNDLAAGSVTWAQFQPAVLAAWKLVGYHLKGPILPVTITPRVNNAGSNAAAQSPINAGFEATRQAYNAWLRAPYNAGKGRSAFYDCSANGITLGQVIDFAACVETNATNVTPGGPGNPNLGGLYWCGLTNNSAGNTTADGIHPNTAGVMLQMQALDGVRLS